MDEAGRARAQAHATAMEALYRTRVAAATRLAYLMTGSQSAAEDIVQDAFVRLFARFRDHRAPDRFDAYLRQTVVNLVRDRGRRAAVERRWLARAATEAAPEQAASDEGNDRVRRALAKLPVRQRAALVLRYLEDLSEEQTADALGCSVAAAKSLTARATRAMRSELGGDPG